MNVLQWCVFSASAALMLFHTLVLLWTAARYLSGNETLSWGTWIEIVDACLPGFACYYMATHWPLSTIEVMRVFALAVVPWALRGLIGNRLRGKEAKWFAMSVINFLLCGFVWFVPVLGPGSSGDRPSAGPSQPAHTPPASSPAATPANPADRPPSGQKAASEPLVDTLTKWATLGSTLVTIVCGLMLISDQNYKRRERRKPDSGSVDEAA